MHNTFNAHTSLRVIKCQLYPRPTLAMACPVFNPHHGIIILLMFLISFARSETTSRSIQHVLFLLASFHSAFEKFICIVLINSISFIFITKDSSKVFISIILDVISRFVVLQVTLLRMVFSMSFPVHVSTILWESYAVSKILMLTHTLWTQRMRGKALQSLINTWSCHSFKI